MKITIEQRIRRQATLAHARRRAEVNERSDELSQFSRGNYRTSMEAQFGKVDWRQEDPVQIPVSKID